MAKAKLLTLTAIAIGMSNVRNGVAFGEKLNEQNKAFAEKLTNRQKTINRLVNDINQYGLSEARMSAAKTIYEDELKGRTLASVVSAHSTRLANALDKCIDKNEETRVVEKFKLESTLKLESLKFLQSMFVEAKKVEEIAQEEPVNA